MDNQPKRAKMSQKELNQAKTNQNQARQTKSTNKIHK